MSASRFLMRNQKVSNFVKWAQQLTFPEKLKGGRIEKYAMYWRGMFLDYKEALSDAAKDAVDHPKRTAVLTGTLGFLFGASFVKPDEEHFHNTLVKCGLKTLLLSDSERNRNSESYLLEMQRLVNQGKLRFFNLGFMTLLWYDNQDAHLGLYSAQCEYLKPRYVDLHQRVMDVGFLDRWWVLQSHMKDYDVNQEEWPTES